MGNCISQSRIRSASKKSLPENKQGSEKKESREGQKQYGIQNEKMQRCLKFECAPLVNSQFLYNKFHHDSNRPDEINLQWQIEKAEYSQNTLRISIINKVPVKVWVVVGGQQRKAMTGLLLQIDKYHSCHVLPISSISQESEPILYEWQIDGKGKQEKVRVILESMSQNSQTLNMIYRYALGEGEARLEGQELMWNNLAFELQPIYNGNEFECGCVICNEEPAACIMIPCKHMCLCKNCLASFKRMYRTCPLCKKEFTEIVIYKDIK